MERVSRRLLACMSNAMSRHTIPIQRFCTEVSPSSPRVSYLECSSISLSCISVHFGCFMNLEPPCICDNFHPVFFRTLVIFFPICINIEIWLYRYKDSSKTAFKSSTRLECMMQDYPRTLSPSAKVGFSVSSLS